MSDKVKHEIFMMYDLAGDKDLIYYEAIQRIIDYIADLEQENERLKRKLTIKKLFKKHKVQTPENFEIRKIFELQRRIDKAIEFINEYAKYNKITINQNKYYDEYILNNVIDILNGRSDE